MSVSFTGLDELKAALRKLPETLATEGGAIVKDAADTAYDQIRTAYGTHYHTGNLVQHLKLEALRPGSYGTLITVRSTARHALLFEVGTQLRYTRKGVARGRMPPANIFVPLARRNRREMYRRLMALMERQGLEVSGGSDL
jgi:hypothetical protein